MDVNIIRDLRVTMWEMRPFAQQELRKVVAQLPDTGMREVFDIYCRANNRSIAHQLMYDAAVNLHNPALAPRISIMLPFYSWMHWHENETNNSLSVYKFIAYLKGKYPGA